MKDAKSTMESKQYDGPVLWDTLSRRDKAFGVLAIAVFGAFVMLLTFLWVVFWGYLLWLL